MRLPVLHRPAAPPRRPAAQDARLEERLDAWWDLDAQQQRALRALEAAQERPLTAGELRDAGIRHPAQTIYELSVAGYDIEHTHRRHSAHGYRLGGGRPPGPRP